MQIRSSFTLLTAALALLASCATSTPTTTTPATRADVAEQCGETAGLYTLNAVLWQQSSVEYRAVAAQTYASARLMLDKALEDPSWTALPDSPLRSGMPPAIALDLDETALDNTKYQARLLHRGQLHDDALFDAFEKEGSAEAIEGSGEFLRYAASRGVKVFYITNRDDLDGGRRVLQKLDFPLDEDSLLFKDARPEWTSSDKTARREWVAERYRLLLLLGDDFNDFVPANGRTLSEREASFARYRHLFGTKWFALPNAMYGSWESSITAGGKTPHEKCVAKYRVLRSE